MNYPPNMDWSRIEPPEEHLCPDCGEDSLTQDDAYNYYCHNPICPYEEWAKKQKSPLVRFADALTAQAQRLTEDSRERATTTSRIKEIHSVLFL